MTSLTYIAPNGGTADLNQLTGNKQILTSWDIQGFGSPPIEHTVVVTPGRHGAQYIESIFAPRIVAIPITVTSFGGTAEQDLWRALMGTANPFYDNEDGSLGELLWQPESSGGTYVLDCILADEFDRSRLGPTVSDAVLPFYAPNPLWRDPDMTSTVVSVTAGTLAFPMVFPLGFGDSSVQGTVSNTGDVISYPTLVLTDANHEIINPQIINTTQSGTLIYSGTIDAGESLTINMAEKTVELDGVNSISKITSSSVFWGLKRGDNVIEVYSPSGNGTVTVTHYNRYIGV